MYSFGSRLLGYLFQNILPRFYFLRTHGGLHEIISTCYYNKHAGRGGGIVRQKTVQT